MQVLFSILCTATHSVCVCLCACVCACVRVCMCVNNLKVLWTWVYSITGPQWNLSLHLVTFLRVRVQARASQMRQLFRLTNHETGQWKLSVGMAPPMLGRHSESAWRWGRDISVDTDACQLGINGRVKKSVKEGTMARGGRSLRKVAECLKQLPTTASRELQTRNNVR